MEFDETIAKIILAYESDTFSASGTGVTRRQALLMASRLRTTFTRLLRYGGHMTIDGTVYADLHQQVRRSR